MHDARSDTEAAADGAERGLRRLRWLVLGWITAFWAASLHELLLRAAASPLLPEGLRAWLR